MLLFRHGGKASSSPPSPGELTAVVVTVVLQGKEYHVVAAVEGHELEAPKAEQRPGLKRLLETTHLELNGKLFVNTQQAPTWRANYRRFDPGGSLDRRVNLSLSCARGDALAVGVTSVREGERERESEPVRQPVLPRDPLA
jgi:hypothetical protein